MKAIQYKLHAVFTRYMVFVSYRWAAWLFATLVVVVWPTADQLLHIWLLLFTAVFNVALTLCAQAYVRIVRRRSFFLLLDVLGSVTLVWASGGLPLPFLPYALGALILPAMLFGWRGALGMSSIFVVFDSVAFLNVMAPSEMNNVMVHALLRLAVPPVFALCCAMAPWLVVRIAMLLPLTTASREPTQAIPSAAKELLSKPQANRFREYTVAQDQAEANPKPAPTSTSVTTQLTTLRAATEHHNQEKPHPLYGVTYNSPLELSTALNQMIADFTQQHQMSVYLTQIGSVQHLTAVQSSTLLHLAQEALHNIQHHAHAQSAQLRLHYQARKITLVIQDDGVGLLDGTYQRPGVHALRAVYYRFAELDGQLEVFEGEKGGVTVRGSLPLPV